MFTRNIRERSVTFRKPGRPDALTGTNHSGAAVGSSSNSRGVVHPHQDSAVPWRTHGDTNELIVSGKPMLFNSSTHCSFPCYFDVCFVRVVFVSRTAVLFELTNWVACLEERKDAVYIKTTYWKLYEILLIYSSQISYNCCLFIEVIYWTVSIYKALMLETCTIFQALFQHPLLFDWLSLAVKVNLSLWYTPCHKDCGSNSRKAPYFPNLGIRWSWAVNSSNGFTPCTR